MKRILKTGEISPSQAKKIAERENIAFKDLLTQDVTSKFPLPPVIDKLVVARNLNSLFMEQGVLRQRFAKESGVNDTTLIRYLAGRPRRLSSKILSKIANALHVSLKDLFDPNRPEIKPTKFFGPNLQHLCEQTGVKRSTVCRGFAVSPTTIDELCNGTIAPKPSQVAGLCDLFGASPEELLMRDLTSRRIIRHVDSDDGPRWRLDPQVN